MLSSVRLELLLDHITEQPEAILHRSGPGVCHEAMTGGGGGAAVWRHNRAQAVAGVGVLRQRQQSPQITTSGVGGGRTCTLIHMCTYRTHTHTHTHGLQKVGI